jgi:hypothetical protein
MAENVHIANCGLLLQNFGFRVAGMHSAARLVRQCISSGFCALGIVAVIAWGVRIRYLLRAGYCVQFFGLSDASVHSPKFREIIETERLQPTLSPILRILRTLFSRYTTVMVLVKQFEVIADPRRCRLE